jgi:hypothetical protein
MKTIFAKWTPKGWMAQYVDDREEITAAFGTDTIPTAFTAKAPGETVRKELERLNPDTRVHLLI